MKNFLFAAAIAIATFTTSAIAGPTENITGCATTQADNSNFTVFVDPNCFQADEGSGSDALLVNLVQNLPVWTDPEDK